MSKVMRESTLQTLGLGNVIDIFQNGRTPADTAGLVDQVFGNAGNRGSLVISGANGIVGAGKTMQLGSRLEPFGVRVVGLDFPSAPDGIGRQYPGLVQAFGREGADRIMGNITRMSYDGSNLPAELKNLQPRFLLEAIPEILEIKRAHYKLFRDAFPGIEIRSVTSGFPSSELGVGIAHPAFPHEINKIWEIVEPEPSAVTQLFWAMGLIPLPVSDNWSFILDVLFCGVTLAGLRYHDSSNMPFWKIDKFTRKLLGPNPFRAHDAIGAKGADFLTWSCLHHLSETYGELFRPTAVLEERKETGQTWYPPNHFRPLVDWSLDAEADQEFRTWILGPMLQMTSLMLQEKRGHLSHLNAIGELCAQFRRGILAVIRDLGPDSVIATVEDYHRLYPDAKTGKSWFPAAFEAIETPEWQQLYVNAEHDGTVGVITINRETYNWDVDHELNRAIDWLKAEGIDRVIVTGDFHISTQMIGADTSDFFSALENFEDGYRITSGWPATARRLNDEFAVSVGFVNGKRCLGGMLELLIHCHYLVSVDDAQLGWPEVTLPVVPGMEACHWPFRKADQDHWPKLLQLLLTGRPARATDAVGWLVDYAGPLDQAIQTAWKVAAGDDHGLQQRALEAGALKDIPAEVRDLPYPDSPGMETARGEIIECMQQTCALPLAEALEVQAKRSADFLASATCREGQVGAEYKRTMSV
jgi:enoyl-CoA hydratase/carnithine racemase/3-hydroxyacyl-CoA dehydrogenase